MAGPTAVGKGTVSADIRQRYPEVWLSVSVTTREPRPGEIDAVNYHFVGPDRFAEMVAGVNSSNGQWSMVVIVTVPRAPRLKNNCLKTFPRC